MMDASLKRILPDWLQQAVAQENGMQLQEIRLRRDKPVQLILKTGEHWLEHRVSREDLNYCVNAASRYSPWTAETSARGYLTAPGGHRIGISGSAVIHHDEPAGIRTISSLCIRVAKEIRGAAAGIPALQKSCLILGPPGSGKTTLLRDLIRQRSTREKGSICVIDEREEVFPMLEGVSLFDCGPRTDILSGWPKPRGVDMALRTMGPQTIAMDEVTAEADSEALISAGGCGVYLLATVHAGSMEEFRSRKIYDGLSALFQMAVVLQPDQTWKMERMEQ